MASLRNIAERIGKLEQDLLPVQEVMVIALRYVSVPPVPIMAWENKDIGFYCVRLPDETEEQHYLRAVEEVKALPLRPGSCGHLIYSRDAQTERERAQSGSEQPQPTLGHGGARSEPQPLPGNR